MLELTKKASVKWLNKNGIPLKIVRYEDWNENE